MQNYAARLARWTSRAGLAAALALTFASAFSATSSLAQALPPATPLKLPELKFEKYTLPNGLTVITHEDHRLPLVAVDLWYHVGPLNERAGRTGFAHLFEHMMFEGAKHVGEKAHIKFVQGAGATDVNGTTSFDRTNYFETVPSNQLELALWLESDRMGFLLERSTARSSPTSATSSATSAARAKAALRTSPTKRSTTCSFPRTTPTTPTSSARHADIEAARIADIRDFFQQFYTPNNASIAIAGDFDPAQVKALLAKYFGPIPRARRSSPSPPPRRPSPRRNAPPSPTPSSSRSFASRCSRRPPIRPATPTLALAAYVLGGAKASRLDQKFVYKPQTAQSVSCGHDALKLTSIVECDITAKPGVKLEDLEATFWQESQSCRQTAPLRTKLDSARTIQLTRKINGLQRLGGFGGVADTLDSYNQYTGDPGYLPKDIARYQAATVASVKQAAAQIPQQKSGRRRLLHARQKGRRRRAPQPRRHRRRRQAHRPLLRRLRGRAKLAQDRPRRRPRRPPSICPSPAPSR